MRVEKRGQITIFVIIAVILVGGILVYLAFRGGGGASSIDPEFRPVYDHYLSCLSATTHEGIALLGEQGGYIETPDFEPGSAYMPFSSHLDFFGQGVPYWLYVAGNNVVKEQVPTVADMELDLEEYVGDRLQNCDFADFSDNGYDVYLDEGVVSVSIESGFVDVSVDQPLTLFFEEKVSRVSRHEATVDSKLGEYYALAIDIYNHERTSSFLENYAIDVMRLYAPVTGADISCEPKVFVEENIRSDIVDGLSSNIPALKLEGDYYSLASAEQEYFVTDIGRDVTENVNFMYSPSWPSRIELFGETVIEPVGTQEGLGILGFCYVPYHLVYDIVFPVMIQLHDDSELFQFPVSVVILKNQAREPLSPLNGFSRDIDACEFRNNPVSVFTYDTDLNPVEASVRYSCFDSLCSIGSTVVQGSDAILGGAFPSCVNGIVTASAAGYADAKQTLSTTSETSTSLILRTLHEIPLDLGGEIQNAYVRFESGDYTQTIVYPDQRSVTLVEGLYNISVTAFTDSKLSLPGINERRCFDVPESGVAGFLGAETEKCVDIIIPATDVTSAVIGGGNSQDYFTTAQLRDSTKLTIAVPLFSTPTSLEDVQKNYLALENEPLLIDFI